MKRILVALLLITTLLTGCDTKPVSEDTKSTMAVADKLSSNQPTPTDIDYSLERYNLIRRAYWVNGQREKANALVSQVDKPLGYVVLFTESGSTVGRFVVDGKVSSLNSYLTPNSMYYECAGEYCNGNNRENEWVADVDGSFGENDSGIFFFTPDGKYVRGLIYILTFHLKSVIQL